MRHRRFQNKNYYHPEQEQSLFSKVVNWIFYLGFLGWIYYVFVDTAIKFVQGGK
jgi:hypothetical protein